MTIVALITLVFIRPKKRSVSGSLAEKIRVGRLAFFSLLFSGKHGFDAEIE